MQRRTLRNQVSIISLVLAGALVAPQAFGRPAPKASPAAPAPGTPTKEEVTRATAAFTQGTKAFQAKKFNLALDNFKQSYETVPSPNSHLYMARCLNELGELKDAFRTFQKVVVEADQRAATEPKYAPTRDSAKSELDDLSAKIGVLTVVVPTTDPGAHVKVNGVPLPPEDWSKEIPLDPGPVSVSLEVPGQAAIVKKIDLVKGVKQSVTLDKVVAAPAVAPVPVQPVTTHSSTGPFIPLAIVGGSIGVVGMVMFAVTGAQSKSSYSKLSTECGGAQACPDHTHDDEISKGKLQQTLANVGLGVGIVGLVAGGGFLVAAIVTGNKKTTAPASAIQVTPQIGPGYAGLSGSF